MKAFRTTLIILGIAVLVVAPMLIVDNYKSSQKPTGTVADDGSDVSGG
jgi:hypothetical protein